MIHRMMPAIPLVRVFGNRVSVSLANPYVPHFGFEYHPAMIGRFVLNWEGNGESWLYEQTSYQEWLRRRDPLSFDYVYEYDRFLPPNTVKLPDGTYLRLESRPNKDGRLQCSQGKGGPSSR